MQLNVGVRVLHSQHHRAHRLLHTIDIHTYIHDKCVDEFNVVTHETEPTESLILLHSLMIRSQLGSPRPLVADTVAKGNTILLRVRRTRVDMKRYPSHRLEYHYLDNKLSLCFDLLTSEV